LEVHCCAVVILGGDAAPWSPWEVMLHLQHASVADGGALLLSAGLMVVVVGWLIGAGASCCMIVGVLEAWVRPCLGSMPGQRWRRLRPSFTFLEALLHCCRTPLVQI
jgi:hypothetical protein